MSKIKYFINHREPNAIQLADQLRAADIDFASIPTSGCSTIWVDGRAGYGITAVDYTISQLVKNPQGYRYKDIKENKNGNV